MWALIFLQLIQVDKTIASCTDATQIDSLQNLKNDLTELLDLTEEQLTELDSGQSNNDPFEDEMKLFLSEIRNVEGADEVSDDDLQAKIDAIKVNE